MKTILFLSCVVAACSQTVCAQIALVPMPQKLVEGSGVYVSTSDYATVAVQVTHEASIPAEGYRLTVAPTGIAVASSDAAGAFYARQTLRQLAEKTKDGFRYPCVAIEDAPAYRWRGFLIDDGRHFFGKQAVKQTLDLMAQHKLNVLHWHLTEDQGWRLDVPAYPELAKKGSFRRSSPAHGAILRRLKPGTHLFAIEQDGIPYGPYYYTADDVREVLAYAKARHITVVPEIELPGHSLGVLGAYPELCCFPENIKVGAAHNCWGVFDDVLCVGNPKTLEFLFNVLDYVCELFPDSPVIHIGGDECPRENWKRCPKCQAKMRELGLTKAGELQAWISKQVIAHLAQKGRRAMGWDELLGSGDVPKTTIGQSWRSKQRPDAEKLLHGAEAAAAGFDMVVSPHNICYFDYPLGLAEPDGLQYPLCKNNTMREAYEFDPARGVAESARHHILGSEACLWSEFIWNEYDLAWKAWPRTCALAEALWTKPAEPRDFAAFQVRLAVQRQRLLAQEVHCSPVK